MSSVPYLLIKKKCEQVFRGKYKIYDDDVIYDTMTSIICQYKKSSANIQNLEAWLIGAIHHHYCSYIANKNKKSIFTYDEFLMENSVSPDAFLDSKIDVNVVKAEIDELQSPYKDILKLRLLGDQSHKEIAKELDMNEASVRKYYSRSIKKLAKLFDVVSHFVLISYLLL